VLASLSVDVNAALAVNAATFGIVATVGAAVLAGRCPWPRLLAWTGAMVGLALALLLLLQRGVWPDGVTVLLGNGLLFGSVCLAWMALDAERTGAVAPRVPALTGAVLMLLFGLAVTLLPAQIWGPLGTVLFACLCLALAASAFQVARTCHGRGAMLVALPVGLVAVLLLVHAAQVAAGQLLDGSADDRADFALSALIGTTVASVATMGFVGMHLERWWARERERRENFAETRESGRLAQAEARALAERLQEREQSARLLAHEVRQPLHGARAAVQAAREAFAGHSPQAAGHALDDVDRILLRIAGTVENTLIAGPLLERKAPLVLADVDLGTLFDLVVADLAPEGRRRVRAVHDADARSARLEPALMRLALRNLLTNSVSHGRGAVVLRVVDCEQPLGVAFEVLDEGPGLPEAVLGWLDAGAAAEPAGGGMGLGLVVARRVAELHGGSLRATGGGRVTTAFRLTLPLAEPA
jgi:signal transduction histidine kinase